MSINYDFAEVSSGHISNAFFLDEDTKIAWYKEEYLDSLLTSNKNSDFLELNKELIPKNYNNYKKLMKRIEYFIYLNLTSPIYGKFRNIYHDEDETESTNNDLHLYLNVKSRDRLLQFNYNYKTYYISCSFQLINNNDIQPDYEPSNNLYHDTKRIRMSSTMSDSGNFYTCNINAIITFNDNNKGIFTAKVSIRLLDKNDDDTIDYVYYYPTYSFELI